MRHGPVLRRSLIAVGACLVPTACSGGGSPAATPTAGAPAAGTVAPGSQGLALQQQFVAAVNKIRPAVVLITTGSALGSGVVFDDRGDIVTNAHVVGASSSFQVQLASGKTASAALVGSFAGDDLAVIRVQGVSGLRAATFSDSSKLEVGDIVLAVGNPLGLASSVTEGIVSATGRTVSEPQEPGSPGATIPDAVQTSAAINPGNSGGALVDLSGNVVGIPTLAASDPQLGGGAAPGIGFAIPSNTVRDIAGQIVTNGRVINTHRAALGVRVFPAVDAGGQPAGAGIAGVLPGGPADKAGLTAGEVITAVDGRQIATPDDLSGALAKHQPGDGVKVDVVTEDGSTKTVSVTLGELSAG